MIMQYLKYPRLHNHVRKVCALAVATLILPALAQAGTDNGKGNCGQNNGNQYGKDKGDPTVSSVPEANTAWVLVPFMGAVLIFSARHLFREKVTE
jgi:hypothetical protein